MLCWASCREGGALGTSGRTERCVRGGRGRGVSQQPKGGSKGQCQAGTGY